jgi:hypothetical protein
MDGLPNVVTAGSSTRIRFPRPGQVEPQPARKDDPNHEVSLGVAFVNDMGRDGISAEAIQVSGGNGDRARDSVAVVYHAGTVGRDDQARKEFQSKSEWLGVSDD